MSLISKNHLSLTLQSIKRLLSDKADKSDVEASLNAVSILVGDTSVATQISDAISQKSQVQIITWEDDD